ncbi:hypothetical protein U1Q18_024803 [Sarracenia purpurea var. burkii]
MISLRLEFKDLVITVAACLNPLSFSELHSLLLSQEFLNGDSFSFPVALSSEPSSTANFPSEMVLLLNFATTLPPVVKMVTILVVVVEAIVATLVMVTVVMVINMVILVVSLMIIVPALRFAMGPITLPLLVTSATTMLNNPLLTWLHSLTMSYLIILTGSLTPVLLTMSLQIFLPLVIIMSIKVQINYCWEKLIQK